jgi:hypothetical protein
MAAQGPGVEWFNRSMSEISSQAFEDGTYLKCADQDVSPLADSSPDPMPWP